MDDRIERLERIILALTEHMEKEFLLKAGILNDLLDIEHEHNQ